MNAKRYGARARVYVHETKRELQYVPVKGGQKV